jgi:hypothetical protein
VALWAIQPKCIAFWFIELCKPFFELREQLLVPRCEVDILFGALEQLHEFAETIPFAVHISSLLVPFAENIFASFDNAKTFDVENGSDAPPLWFDDRFDAAADTDLVGFSNIEQIVEQHRGGTV